MKFLATLTMLAVMRISDVSQFGRCEASICAEGWHEIHRIRAVVGRMPDGSQIVDPEITLTIMACRDEDLYEVRLRGQRIGGPFVVLPDLSVDETLTRVYVLGNVGGALTVTHAGKIHGPYAMEDLLVTDRAERVVVSKGLEHFAAVRRGGKVILNGATVGDLPQFQELQRIEFTSSALRVVYTDQNFARRVWTNALHP